MTADGAKLVFQSNRTGHYNVWSLDVASGKESPATASAQEQVWPSVSPEGSKVAYSETRIGASSTLQARGRPGAAPVRRLWRGRFVLVSRRQGVLIDSLQQTGISSRLVSSGLQP